MWSRLCRINIGSRRCLLRHALRQPQSRLLSGDWDRVNAVRTRPPATKVKKVSEVERRILTTPRDSLRYLCREFVEPLSREPDSVLRAVTLLMDRMARSGMKERDIPELERLLLALAEVVDAVPTPQAVSLLSSIRHLECREKVSDPVLWNLASRMYSTVGDVELRQIPNIMGDLIQLNIGDHPVFEVSSQQFPTIFATANDLLRIFVAAFSRVQSWQWTTPALTWRESPGRLCVPWAVCAPIRFRLIAPLQRRK